MQIGYCTDQGLRRIKNEDSLYVNRVLGLFIVSDGLGGHRAGDVASRMAAQEIPKALRRKLSAGICPQDAVLYGFDQANRAIHAYSMKYVQCQGMGATAVLALLHGENIFIAHVGDSRAYMIINGRMRRLTRDHTVVEDMVRQGQLDSRQARAYFGGNILNRALGIWSEVCVDVGIWPQENCERLLLCSDGLTDMLEDKEIKEIATTHRNPQKACDALVQAANNRAGLDNITVILVAFE